MNYELAKKLKEAGWKESYGVGDSKLDMGILPTLSELIETCTRLSKDGDFHLEAMHGRWSASTCWKAKDDWENGDTPEIAVANLWLKLHENS